MILDCQKSSLLFLIFPFKLHSLGYSTPYFLYFRPLSFLWLLLQKWPIIYRKAFLWQWQSDHDFSSSLICLPLIVLWNYVLSLPLDLHCWLKKGYLWILNYTYTLLKIIMVLLDQIFLWQNFCQNHFGNPSRLKIRIRRCKWLIFYSNTSSDINF